MQRLANSYDTGKIPKEKDLQHKLHSTKTGKSPARVDDIAHKMQAQKRGPAKRG